MAVPFDQRKAYAKQEEVYFDDGREINLLHFIYKKSDINEIRGSPSKVLQAIDEYGRSSKFLMNVGEDKGKIVTDVIAQVKPSTMVELGGYVGYSCILFANALRDAGGNRYFSLERSPEFGAIISSLVELAGLDDIVKVVIGPSDASLRRLHSAGIVRSIDMLFLDHIKPAYLPDLKLCEELRLVTVGSVLAADNVIKPGNPPYLEYVRSTVSEKKELAEKSIAVDGPDPRFSEKEIKQYEKRSGEEKFDQSLKGNPNLVYESRLVESYEPTGIPDGVEITRCIREDA